jgi:hypothetical protein
MAHATVANQLPHKGPPLTRLELPLANTNTPIMSRPFSFLSTQLEQHFLVWEDAPVCPTALPSQQTLLLEKQGV